MNYVPDKIPSQYASAPSDASSQDLLGEAIEICYGSHGTGKAAQTPEYAHLPNSSRRKAGRHQVSRLVRPLEQKALFELARQRGVLFNNQKFTDRWIAQEKLGGAENDVYYNPKTNKWVKRNNLAYHSSYLEFFYRLKLHNHYFATCPIELIGFVVDDGVLKPVVTQVDIESQRGASRSEVEAFMSQHNFVREADSDNYYNADTGIRIEDLHDENVLVTEHGLEFIDPVLYLDERGKERRISRLSERQSQTLVGQLLLESLP